MSSTHSADMMRDVERAADRPFDIALFGATGFTGKLVADYLVRRITSHGHSILLSGRNEVRGRDLIADLSEKYDIPESVTWFTADVDRPDQLAELTQRARVLINVAGPFAEYGQPVVEACVNNGCHYLDITGEPDFYHWVIRTLHEEALSNRVCVINACGFDSIPADLGTYEAVKLLVSKSKMTARAYVRTNARFSGGTWTTAILGISRNHKKPASGRKPSKSKSRKIPVKIHYQKQLRAWALPMPVLDPHVVKRSARRMPEVYGPSFAYGQFFVVGSLWKMISLIFNLSLMFFLTRFERGIQYLLAKHRPGTGPPADVRAKTSFEVHIFAESADDNSNAVISGGDPGYNETSMMVSQAAFCLLNKLDRSELKFGVLTTAEALGSDLVKRIRREGLLVDSWQR